MLWECMRDEFLDISQSLRATRRLRLQEPKRPVESDYFGSSSSSSGGDSSVSPPNERVEALHKSGEDKLSS